MNLLAQAGDLSNPLGYGVVGTILTAFTGLLLTGKLVPGREHDRVVEENKELRRQVPDVVASQTASTVATQEATKVMRDVLVVLQVLNRGGGP